MTVLCVLPARIGSERLPRKPLRTIAGRTLVEWSWRAARRVPAFDRVVVATDSGEVARAVRSFGGEAVLTRPDHPTGTDRVAEVASLPACRDHGIVVNFQADEPFVPPGPVGRALRTLAEGGAEMATLAAPLRDEAEWRDPSVVKVVRDARGRALYFSRAPVPFPRDGVSAPGRGERAPEEGGDGLFLRHVGIYLFRREALERWRTLPSSRLERLERLEQLRALEAGMAIRVETTGAVEAGIDTPADLERAARLLVERDPRPGNPEIKDGTDG